MELKDDVNAAPADKGADGPGQEPTTGGQPEPAQAVPQQVPGITVPTGAPKRSSARARLAAVLLLLVVLVVAGAVFWRNAHKTKQPAAAPAKVVRLGISMDSHKELRWQKDEQYLQQYAHESGVAATVMVADSDDALQVSQIENFISQKVDVILVIPHDSKAVEPALKKAHEAGIKVLAYDRLSLGAPLDYYVSFNNETVGKQAAQYVVDAAHVTSRPANIAFVGGAPTDNNAPQIHTGAMSVLDPLVASGKVKLVYDKPTDNWLPDVAYKNLAAFLAQGGSVDGVVAANDGTAFGAIQALQEKGLAGKVPVSGQDADLPAVQRIIAGTQTMTNYKPVKDLAKKAIDVTVALAQGQVPTPNAQLDNQYATIPSYLLVPIAVTKDNIDQTVIKDGFLTREDVYKQ